MFKKVKSLFNEQPAESRSSSPASSSGGAPKIWTIPSSVREQFEKGGAVRYNIKVVLRGARRTGKTSLMARLQNTFQECKYAPSAEISAATIHYQLETGTEAAKVDLWDVVDEGIPSAPTTKYQPTGMPLRQPADATTVDVYQNCHAAVFLVDVTKRDTWEYVVREAGRVPPTCAICIALNFCDAPKPHAVTERDVVEFSNTLPRCCTTTVLAASQGLPPPCDLSFGPTWVSLSALTGHGIDLMRSFLAVPVALERLHTLESRMRSIYAEIETHQGMMLQMRAMEEFEAKERQKSLGRGDGAEGPEVAKLASDISTTPDVPQVRHVPSISPPSPKPADSPAKETTTHQAQGAGNKTAAASPPAAATPSPPAAPKKAEKLTEAVPVVAPAVLVPKKASLPATAAPSQRTTEEEKRIQEDFYGDITDEEEEDDKEEVEEESDEEPILTPAARKALMLQQQQQTVKQQTAEKGPKNTQVPVEVSPAPVASQSPTPSLKIPESPQGDIPANQSSIVKESASLPATDVVDQPINKKPTWQEDAEKLATMAIEDDANANQGAGGLDAFLDSDSEEGQDSTNTADTPIHKDGGSNVVVDKPNEAVEEATDKEEEPVAKSSRMHRDAVGSRRRGVAPIVVVESSPTTAPQVSDEVNELLKQMAAAMAEDIDSGKTKKSKKDKEEPKDKKDKKKERKEKDGEEGGDLKEKGKREKKEKKEKKGKKTEGEGEEVSPIHD